MMNLCPNTIKTCLYKSLNRLQKCSMVVRTSSDVFGSFRKFLENCWKSLEVAGAFSKIMVMTGQKSHAFDCKKVGRYRNVRRNHLLTGCKKCAF